MNPVMRQLLALYPKTWRERYGAELLDLTDDLVAAGDTTPWRAALDLLAGAMKERGRAAFAPAATIIATGSLIAGAVLAIDHRGGLMKPYFDIHPVGYLLLIVVAFWFFVEFINLMRMQERREEGTGVVRTRRASSWLLGGACAIAANVWLYVAPSLIPAATIRPGTVAFVIGMVILLAGIGLRLWSFVALDGLFSVAIRVHPDQKVVTAGSGVERCQIRDPGRT